MCACVPMGAIAEYIFYYRMCCGAASSLIVCVSLLFLSVVICHWNLFVAFIRVSPLRQQNIGAIAYLHGRLQVVKILDVVAFLHSF